MTVNCHVLLGKILVHPCARATTLSCVRCGQPTCAVHMSRTTTNTCVVCAGEYKPAKPQPDVTLAELTEVDPRDAQAFAAQGNAPATSFDS